MQPVCLACNAHRSSKKGGNTRSAGASAATRPELRSGRTRIRIGTAGAAQADRLAGGSVLHGARAIDSHADLPPKPLRVLQGLHHLRPHHRIVRNAAVRRNKSYAKASITIERNPIPHKPTPHTRRDTR